MIHFSHAIFISFEFINPHLFKSSYIEYQPNIVYCSYAAIELNNYSEIEQKV